MTNKKAQGPSTSPLSGDEKEHAFAFSLLNHLIVPTFVLDAQGKVILWNLACEQLTGIPAEELIGTSDQWKAFYDEPRPCLSDLIVQGRAKEIHQLYAEHGDTASVTNGLFAENWCVMPRVGKRRYLAADASPIYDGAGKLIAVIETTRDVTIQKEAQRTLELLATQDGLTGIANRRRFDESLQLEWSRATRDSKALSLLMVDVDHFKKYNDTYGHQAGDECLKRIASAMSDSVQRTIDLVARYGGEEFAVILPNSTHEGATVVAERIRLAIAQLEFSGVDFFGINVTVSIGVATTATPPGGRPENLIAAADTALYKAKRQGRNRVVATALSA